LLNKPLQKWNKEITNLIIAELKLTSLRNREKSNGKKLNMHSGLKDRPYYGNTHGNPRRKRKKGIERIFYNSWKELSKI
jgi:hypothetical protein